MTKDPKHKPLTPEEQAEEAQVAEAMRKAAEAPPRELTPEEQDELRKKYIEKYKPHPVNTPIYKPPA